MTNFWKQDMEQRLSSVIVPTKDEQMTREDCLRSLRAQRSKYPYEIIVDTGSKVKTPEIADQCGARIIKQDRPGEKCCQARAASRPAPTSWGNIANLTFQEN